MRFRREEGKYLFVIAEDGVGSDKLENHGTSLGMSLIQDMVYQLNAEVKLSTDKGYTYELITPSHEPSE